MCSCRCDRHVPSLQLGPKSGHVAAVASREEVPLHVLHPRLHFALLRRVEGRRGVHFEAVVSRQLAVAPIQLRRSVQREGRADHGCFEIVWNDRLRDASELRKSLGMQREPRLRALVEDNAHHHLSAVSKHHHEAPSLAQRFRRRIEKLADVSEVDLRNLASLGLDGDGDVPRVDATRSLHRPNEALDCRVGTAELWLLEAKAIEDRSWTHALLCPLFDQRLPRTHRTLLLSRQQERTVGEHRFLQLFDRGNRLDVSGEQP